jgi:hypothetical protein
MHASERFYRRLLWAYPGAYRRRHGAEIVTTMLDLAGDGAGRLTAGQTLHLVACGLRQRFRLPARPLAWVAAPAAAVALAAAGAVGGTWLGWQTAAPVPSWSEISVLTTAAAGLPWASVEPWKTAMNGPGVNSTISGTGTTYDPQRIRTALTADGWRITRFTEGDTRFAVGPLITTGTGTFVDGRELLAIDFTKTVPVKEAQFVATKDGLTLTGGTDTVLGGETSLGLDITADDTAAIRPLTIAGMLAGALAGWLLTSAVAYRIRRSGRRARWVAAALGALALAGAAVPAFVAGCDTYQVMVYDTHTPNQYVAAGPADGIPAVLTAVGAALAVAALAGVLHVTSRQSHRPPVPDSPAVA